MYISIEKNTNMLELQAIIERLPSYSLYLILLLFIWDMVWKSIALWKAGRNNQLIWFVCIILFNTIGILPIIYIIQQKKTNVKNKKEQVI